jgi:hypothetical protein
MELGLAVTKMTVGIMVDQPFTCAEEKTSNDEGRMPQSVREVLFRGSKRGAESDVCVDGNSNDTKEKEDLYSTSPFTTILPITSNSDSGYGSDLGSSLPSKIKDRIYLNKRVKTQIPSSILSESLSEENAPEVEPIAVVPQPSSNPFASKPQILRAYPNLKIPELFYHQFQDLKELFEEPFFKALYTGGAPFKAMSWRLMSLGEIEDKAKPCVVIFCDKSVARKSRRFFKQSWVKEQCHPEDADATEPHLDFIVHERAPRLPSLDFPVWKHTGYRVHDVSCGTLLKNETGQIFTLGGLIKVITDEKSCVFGLTCGHPFYHSNVAQNLNPSALEEENSEDSSEDVDVEYILDFGDLEVQQQDSTLSLGTEYGHSRPVSSDTGFSNSKGNSASKMSADYPRGRHSLQFSRVVPVEKTFLDPFGFVSDSSYEQYGDETRNLDWALLSVNNMLPYKWSGENLSVSTNGSGTVNHETQQFSPRDPKVVTVATVYAGLSGPVGGILEYVPAFFALPGSKALLSVYTFRSDSKQG